MTRQHLWRISAGGNSAALVVLLLLLLVSPALVENRPSGDWGQEGDTNFVCDPTDGDSRAVRLVLVVMDGLRADRAHDRRLMPNLTRLATEGGSGVAVVETLIPSTVAAIQALVAGRVVSPLSFFHDFAARRAQSGGVFAGVASCEGETFVAGPRLWVDLYGPWITESAVVEGIGERDAKILQASLAALEAQKYSLIVLHLSRPDDTAHRYGADSLEYADAVRWCDNALAQVLKRVDSYTAVLVTSDHGVTSRGGHAGPEPAARITPVVTSGPNLPHGDIGTLRQRDIPLLISPPLGLHFSKYPFSAALIDGSSLIVTFVLFAGLGVGCGLRFWSAVINGASGRHESTALNIVVWIVLILAWLDWRRTATGLAVVALVAVAVWMRAGKLRALMTALLFGIVCGAVRLTDGFLTSQRETVYTLPEGDTFIWSVRISLVCILSGVLVALIRNGAQAKAVSATATVWFLRLICVTSAVILGGLPLLVLVVGAVGLGVSLGRSMFTTSTRALWGGVIAAVAPVAFARLNGETVSLSTLDVSVAFGVAEGPLGLGGAVAVVILRLALPSLGGFCGLAPALRAGTPLVTGCFATGIAAVMVGQALPAAGLLALHGTDPVLGSLALGTALRVFCELVLSFLGSALALTLSTNTVTGRSKTCAA